MPDQYGRPELSDYTQLINSINAIDNIRDRQQAKNELEKAKFYATQFSTGELDPASFDPKIENGTYKKEDALAAMQGLGTYMANFRNTTEGQDFIKKSRFNSAKESYQRLADARAKMSHFLEKGDKKTALETGLEWVNNSNNPFSGKALGDGTAQIYYAKGGEKQPERKMTAKELLEMAKQFSEKEYFKFHVANSEMTTEENFNNLFTPKTLTNGKKNIRVVRVFDDETRKNKYMFFNLDGSLLTKPDGKEYSKEELARQGYSFKDLATEKDQAALDLTRARTATEQTRNRILNQPEQPKQPSARQVADTQDLNLRHALGQLQMDGLPLEIDPLSGQILGSLDIEQARKFQDTMKSFGFKTYLVPETIDGGWFRKDKEVYRVLDVVPTTMNYTQQRPQQTPNQTGIPGANGPVPTSPPRNPQPGQGQTLNPFKDFEGTVKDIAAMGNVSGTKRMYSPVPMDSPYTSDDVRKTSPNIDRALNNYYPEDPSTMAPAEEAPKGALPELDAAISPYYNYDPYPGQEGLELKQTNSALSPKPSQDYQDLMQVRPIFSNY